VFSVVLTGPLEALNIERGTATVLGQEVALTSATELHSGLHIGDEVVVTGIPGENMFFASTLSDSGDLYVAGASEVFVAGYVSDVDLILGQITVGDATFDINAVSNSSLTAGDYVEIVGTQPHYGGKILAESVGH
jgi:hypothetical protein